jgi:hypothetical protein
LGIATTHGVSLSVSDSRWNGKTGEKVLDLILNIKTSSQENKLDEVIIRILDISKLS